MKFLKNDLQNVTRVLCLVFFFIYGFSTFSQDTLMLKINVKKIVKTLDFNDDFLACIDFPSGDKVFNPDSALEKNRYFHCQISNA
jgi:hypothetical protein